MLKPEAAELLKGVTGLSDEQVAKLHSGQAKMFNNIMENIQYKTVAEVIKSEHCFAQVKVADKLVFDPFLNPEK